MAEKIKSDDMDVLAGKSVLVTGGSGSFGTHFIKTVLDQGDVRRLIVYSRDELKQYEMQMAFQDHPNFHRLRFFLGDVSDYSRIEMALQGVDIIVHAAAQKQVVAAEYNPSECIKNNITGAENIVRAAISCGVRKIVALSTDKAVNPINLYGASKLVSDKVFIAGNNLSGGRETRFSVVRYGNVINSRGSVVPLYNKLIAEGSPFLPVTDDRMTRFWLTLEQGVSFVLASLRMMNGAEIFIPKIPTIKIADLAAAMAPQLEQKIIGIRPGEKLHESLVPADENHMTREYEGHFVVYPSFAFWGATKTELESSGRPLASDFEYRSDTNNDILNAEEIRVFLNEHGLIA